MAGEVTHGDYSDLANSKRAKDQRVSSGVSKLTLGLGKVVTINYEECKVTLRIVSGTDQQFQRIPVPLTFPGAGNRVFLGAMPQVGDVCVLGHIAQESTGGETTPVILSWCLPGPWMGYDWLATSPFSPEEYSMDAKDSAFVQGAYARNRRKLRHMNPGNVVASSGQGSDLVLDDGVLLSSRRCNEIRLRDQDQALVVRSLQQFHAMAGVRVYSGMVQRDATLLPTQMISDGTYWETPFQVDPSTKVPLDQSILSNISHPSYPRSFLSPNDVFNRIDLAGNFTKQSLSGVSFDPNVDPYDFLKRGLFINKDGYLYDEKVIPSSVYGGKPGYRVSINTDEFGNYQNGFLGGKNNAESFTEYRLEVSHTSDGTLPVTEQTDNFDAERLPSSTGSNTPGKRSPFVTVIYGSVIGNDPFTPTGREKYGIPLKPVLFTAAGDLAPEMASGLGSPLSEHAATLFQVNPINSKSLPTFWSVTKDGRVKLSVQGPKTAEFSAEAYFASGLKVVSGGAIQLEAAKGVHWKISGRDEVTNRGLNLSTQGAIRIHADGDTTEGGVARGLQPSAKAAGSQTSLELGGRNKVQINAGKKVEIVTETITQQAQKIQLQAMSGVSVNAANNIDLNSNVFNQSVSGKAEYSFYGPKDLLPTNGAHRTTRFSGLGIGTVDDYSVILGDREETFQVGNHSTSIQVGNLTYKTLAGTWKATAGVNKIELDALTGLQASVAVGSVKIEALAGTTEVVGQGAVTVKSIGPATISSYAGIFLKAPGKKGGIVSSSDLDPLTGTPLGFFAMGSPGHLLT